MSVPGDKSITHRALLLSAVASGTTIIAHPNRGADAAATIQALRQLGVRVLKRGNTFVVDGAITLRDPVRAIDCGNSGTTMRLLMGLLAGRVDAILDGDLSLRRRPMERVASPLRAMGAKVDTSANGTPPVRMRRVEHPLRGFTYKLPMASAQLKSALLLAGLRAQGKTVLVCGDQSRDHTERMLRLMKAKIALDGSRIVVRPSTLRSPKRICVPGDFSAGFYLLAAAVTLPGMRLVLKDIGLNPSRTAALRVLQDMGAAIEIKQRKPRSGEPVGDIIVLGGAALHGVRVRKRLVPNLLDEIPALCALAATAQGTFQVRGAGELKVKESDRIATTVKLLRSFGADARALPDGIAVRGGKALRAPQESATHGDHRIGMAAAILAVAARSPITITDPKCMATSFPEFRQCWRRAFGS